MKRIRTKIALSALVLVFVSGLCGGRGTQSQQGETPQVQLQIHQIRSGAIADVMRTKKAAVFALANPMLPYFRDWLQLIPEGLDTVKLYKGDTEQEKPQYLYVLFGWSRWGADELRRAVLDSAVVQSNQINVYGSRPHLQKYGNITGSDDMVFKGWEIPLEGKLPPATYKAFLNVQQDTLRVFTQPQFHEELIAGPGYEIRGEIEFTL